MRFYRRAHIYLTLKSAPQMESATTWPRFTARISQLQPKDTYTATESLCTP